MSKIDEDMFDLILSELAEDDYIDDNGFTAGVMHAVDQQLEARFAKLHVLLPLLAFIIGVGLTWSLITPAFVSQQLQMLFSQFDALVVIPIVVLFGVMMSAACLDMVKD